MSYTNIQEFINDLVVFFIPGIIVLFFYNRYHHIEFEDNWLTGVTALGISSLIDFFSKYVSGSVNCIPLNLIRFSLAFISIFLIKKYCEIEKIQPIIGAKNTSYNDLIKFIYDNESYYTNFYLINMNYIINGTPVYIGEKREYGQYVTLKSYIIYDKNFKIIDDQSKSERLITFSLERIEYFETLKD